MTVDYIVAFHRSFRTDRVDSFVLAGGAGLCYLMKARYTLPVNTIRQHGAC